MHLAELASPEVFVISSLRLWALPHCDPAREYPDWERGFVQAGLGVLAASSFEALCRIIASAAPSGLSIHPMSCGHLGQDEARLLHTLWLLQRSRLAHAHVHLQDWCCPTAARLAIGPACTLALIMQSQHMLVTFHEPRTVDLHARQLIH
jgi:hypothetical protein